MNYADKRILVVEDQRPFLMLLRGLLNSMGATDVIICTSADQAVASCKKQKFDIVIADLHLGSDKKNGFELIEELRFKKLIKPSTIFLIISADSARPVVLGSIERRPDDYLVKPFSQAQLKSRIARAWQKRQYLLPVYSQIIEEKWPEAIDKCQQIAESSNVFQRYANQLLVELYWRKEQYDRAETLLLTYMESKPPLWAQIAMGRTYLYLEVFEKAKTIANEVLKANRFSAEAFDILAEAESHLGQSEPAILAIKQAIKISPFSLPRHLSACEIAKKNRDYELLTEASLSIWQLSKRTIHQDVSHWCNYLRSILDAAEHAEDRRTKNKYQQEALLLVQRGRFDDVIIRQNENFDISIFEELVAARIEALDGKMLDAKKRMLQSQLDIETKFGNVPASLATDSLKIMFDIGEFDDVHKLVETLKETNQLDTYSEQLLKHESRVLADKQSNYMKHNKDGIKLYQEGKFENAKEQFELALEYAPVNSGVALNLVQCIIKILDKGKKPEPLLVKQCRKVYKLVQGMPLRANHQEKLRALQDDIDRYLGK